MTDLPSTPREALEQAAKVAEAAHANFYVFPEGIELFPVSNEFNEGFLRATKFIATAIRAIPVAEPLTSKLVEALREARGALHHHFVEWDGEPEDAVPLQLARSQCDAALAAAEGRG